MKKPVLQVYYAISRAPCQKETSGSQGRQVLIFRSSAHIKEMKNREKEKTEKYMKLI